MFSPSEAIWITVILYVCILAAVAAAYIQGWMASKVEKAVLQARPLRTEHELVVQRSFWSFLAFKQGPVLGMITLFPVVGLISSHGVISPVSVVVSSFVGIFFGWVLALSVWARTCLRVDKAGVQLTGAGYASPLFLAWDEIESVRMDQYNGEAALFLHDKIRRPILISPDAIGCPPEFLQTALKTWHDAAQAGFRGVAFQVA